jgi:hypothetical protein
MAASEKDRFRAFAEFLAGFGVTVKKLGRSESMYRLVLDGPYEKLPDYTRACMRTLEEPDGFCAYIKVKQIERAMTAPPASRASWTRRKERINGEIVESTVARTRVPGIAYNGQFLLGNDPRCGVVDFNSKAGDYAKRAREKR